MSDPGKLSGKVRGWAGLVLMLLPLVKMLPVPGLGEVADTVGAILGAVVGADPNAALGGLGLVGAGLSASAAPLFPNRPA